MCTKEGLSLAYVFNSLESLLKALKQPLLNCADVNESAQH